MAQLNPTVARVTERIAERSHDARSAYLARIEAAASRAPARAHLSCGNQAHAFAAMDAGDKADLAAARKPNLGIVTAYNDMLSAHQPFETYPDVVRKAAREAGGTAQVAGGVPAMCDGVTQGRAGMELSLFSRDVIAMAAGVALSHDTFDAAVHLGVCDKIVPGLVIAAATFGHLPAVFLPAGPMPSGLPNEEKARVRRLHAEGGCDRATLLASEMASYHGPGTCTFYGTANTNQMLMELMGLHLPGTSFIAPNTPLREALTSAGARRALEITRAGDWTPAGHVLDERAFVNGIVGLHATGGSTNLVIHLVAMAKAAGITLTPQDFSDLSDVVPLIARVYPNGLADVNGFHAAGGLAFVVRELLGAGLVHDDTLTVAGRGLHHYTKEPKLRDGELVWESGAAESLDRRILRPVSDPFASEGGLKRMSGNLGRGVMKVSAVAPENRVVEAPCAVFHDQNDVKRAFEAGLLDRDVVVVVRFQGPRANGMPELHSLTPALTVLQGRGHAVALVTDGRMSGASGKVPAAIHVCPEALDGGAIARLRDGDVVRVDGATGELSMDEAVLARSAVSADLSAHAHGMGREMFAAMRMAASDAETGADALAGPTLSEERGDALAA